MHFLWKGLLDFLLKSSFCAAVLIVLTKSISLLIWIPDKACDKAKDNR